MPATRLNAGNGSGADEGGPSAPGLLDHQEPTLDGGRRRIGARESANGCETDDLAQPRELWLIATSGNPSIPVQTAGQFQDEIRMLQEADRKSDV